MGEHNCVVSYCCCGCSLRDGSLAIGIIILIMSLLDAVYLINVAIETEDAGVWISFVINLVVIITSCLLIHGIRKERRGYVMSWVWMMMVLIFINIIVSIILLVETMNLYYGLLTLVVMGISIYLVVVVRSYGLSLNSGFGMA